MLIKTEWKSAQTPLFECCYCISQRFDIQARRQSQFWTKVLSRQPYSAVPFPDEKSFIVSNIGGDNWRCLHGRFWIAKQEWYQARWGDQ